MYLTRYFKGHRGTIIIFFFRPGGDINGAEELSTFLHMALTKGYQFKTVDTYLTDNDS